MDKINKIKKFVQRNITNITIIIIIIVVIVFAYMGYRYLINVGYIETLENTSNGLESILDKEIYLKFVIPPIEKKPGVDTEHLYLAITPRAGCDNIKKEDLYECIFNTAILHKEKNKFSKFIISKVPDSQPARYILYTKLDSIIPKAAKFSQNINYLELKKYKDVKAPVCFDNGEDSVINLEIIENNSGQLKLIFNKEIFKQDKKETKQYFIGICPNSICTQGSTNHKRLCLFDNAVQGILFDVEME